MGNDIEKIVGRYVMIKKSKKRKRERNKKKKQALTRMDSVSKKSALYAAAAAPQPERSDRGKQHADAMLALACLPLLNEDLPQ
jgi:hypothetical protein